MNLVETTANKVAVYIHEKVENSSSVAVLRFSLINVFNYFIVTLFILFVCLITDNIAKGFIALVSYSFLRYFSGGFHLKSGTACNIVSSFLILLATHLSLNYIYTGFILNIAAIFFLLLYAPQGILNLSRINAKYYPVLKTISILIV